MAKIFEFSVPEKAKEESTVRDAFEFSREQQNAFSMKCAEVVEILFSLKQADPKAIKKENVEIRRKQIRGSSPDVLKQMIMSANEILIKQHPAYYEAVTDEIYERKLNKPKP